MESIHRLNPRLLFLTGVALENRHNQVPWRAFPPSDQAPKCSAINEPREHVTDMILSTEKHGLYARRLPSATSPDPAHRAIDRQVTHARQDHVMTLASIRNSQGVIRFHTDCDNPCFDACDCSVGTLARIEMAFEKMVENEPEIAFGVSRGFKAKCHARGACRQSVWLADCPFLPIRQTRRTGDGRGPRVGPCVGDLQSPNAVAAD